MAERPSIVPESLPRLRRFARVLTGSQQIGDACVSAAVESIIDGQFADIPARMALHRSILTAVDAINAIPVSDRVGTRDPVEKNLSSMTPVGRQAYLLVTLEGFSLEEAALLLEMTPQEVQLLLDDAEQDLASQMATGVLIIEDEPLIAVDLEELVQSMGHRVVRIAETEQEALKAITETRPGLVLSDIQLADGSSGLDAVIKFLPAYPVPVVFITAYPERYLTGVKPEPTFLIEKPYNRDALKAIIHQALFFHRVF
ncbi:MAG: response regulator [Halobacteriota archaeon]